MPEKPDYPDWRDVEPPKEERKKVRKPERPSEELLGTGLARNAGKLLKKNREEKERLLKELE